MTRTAEQEVTTDPPWRPGWAEVAIGVSVMLVVGFGLGSQIHRLGLDRSAYGLVMAGWSGLACFAGFAAAWRLRRQSLATFGVQATSRRWLLVGMVVGVIAFVAKGVAVLAFTALTGVEHSPQGVYAAGGSGGIVSLVTATFLIGIVVPLGEEFLFRGVMVTALLRYGSIIAVVGSALVFALLHGISIIFPAALVQGLVAGEIYRRSGSIWPAVVVHMVYNLPTVPVMVLAAGAA